MRQQNDEDLRSTEEAKAVRELLESKGWKLIDFLLKEKAETVRLKRNLSDDPSVVMACVRQEDGIMFIYEVINDFLNREGDSFLELSN